MIVRLVLSLSVSAVLLTGCYGAGVPDAPQNPIEGDPMPNQGGAGDDSPDTGSTLAQEVPNPQPAECDHDTAGNDEAENLVATAREAGDYSVLVELIEGTDLADRLSVDGPFTLLAPTDEAFAELPPGLLDVYRDNPEDLEGLLRNHVVPGACSVEDLRAADVAPTLGGQDVSYDELDVVAPDIPAENGMLQGIGTVRLLPPVPSEDADGTTASSQLYYQGRFARTTDDGFCAVPRNAATPERCFVLDDAELPDGIGPDDFVQVRYVREDGREIALNVTQVLD